MPEFRFGNRELADRLGLEVVGEPLTGEIPFAAGNTIQATTRGVLLYFEELPARGIPGSIFLPGAVEGGEDAALPPIPGSEGQDLRPALEAAASRAGIPLELAVACAVAESGLHARAERWGTMTDRARRAIESRDREALASIIAAVWPDISFGLGQRIVQFHYLGDRSATVENCLAVREGVFADPARDLMEMASLLGSCLAAAGGADLGPVGGNLLLGALVVYNHGSMPGPADPYWIEYAGNVESYRQALATAVGIL